VPLQASSDDEVEFTRTKDISDSAGSPIQPRKVGCVFQNHVFFPHLTAEENVSRRKVGRPASARDRVQELFYAWNSKGFRALSHGASEEV
jgi:ABC-type Fe3+/spermidine/putrescine transport system ATPase subunit